MKKCIECNLERPLSDFNLRKKGSILTQSRCKVCESKRAKELYKNNRLERILNQRKVNILNKYGVTEDDYKTMLKTQKSKCAICGSTEIKRKGAKYFNIDHCHETNKVRGLLCHNCNIVLGKIEDSKAWLKQALIYLS
jgi:hypothetical protein